MKTRIFGALLLSLFSFSATACKSDDDGDDDEKMTMDVDAGLFPKPKADDCITKPKSGTAELECEGLKFILDVPKACLEEACGLIIDVHGYGMDGMMQKFHSSLTERAGKQGYIVLHPSSPGMVPTSSWSQTGGNDDQVLAIIQRVMGVYHVNEERVHMSGYSQGGFMTWRFLCKHSKLLASVAPMAAGNGTGSCSFMNEDAPDFARPILYTHGTSDGLVAFDTAPPQRDAVIAVWGLSEEEEIESGDDYSWTRYSSSTGATLEFIQHDWSCDFVLGGRPLKGHCFPGNSGLLGCGRDTPVDWGKAVVDFFVAHPRDEK